MQAQTTSAPLPYHQIPEAPQTYTAATMAARMIDGLGFRYYWATEGLKKEDLAYQIDESTRTMAETLEHIHGLCEVVRNAIVQQPNLRPKAVEQMDFKTQRRATLLMLKEASDLLRQADTTDLINHPIVFKRGENEASFPFWNVLNGPLADAIWHVGQVVVFRRASGNPMDSRVDVFQGKLRN